MVFHTGRKWFAAASDEDPCIDGPEGARTYPGCLWPTRSRSKADEESRTRIMADPVLGQNEARRVPSGGCGTTAITPAYAGNRRQARRFRDPSPPEGNAAQSPDAVLRRAAATAGIAARRLMGRTHRPRVPRSASRVRCRSTIPAPARQSVRAHALSHRAESNAARSRSADGSPDPAWHTLPVRAPETACDPPRRDRRRRSAKALCRPSRYGPSSGACIIRHGKMRVWNSAGGNGQAQVLISTSAHASLGFDSANPRPVGPPQS